MNILFLSLGRYDSIEEHEMYTDLLRGFIRHGDEVYMVSPTERRDNQRTQLIQEDHCQLLKVRTGNIQKTNVIEKGISTVLLEMQFTKAIQKYFKNIHFDLVLYPTPPITLVKPVRFVKKRDGVKTYLMLKDIFPQNAVDLGMFGAGSPFYSYFRKKEKKLYALSDRIGCMSQANVDYLLKHNPEIDPANVSVCPNSIEMQDVSVTPEKAAELRKKYDIPPDRKIFVYGGNLGQPQGIDFMIDCFRSQAKNDKAFFLIVGSGTEYGKIEKYVADEKSGNVKLLQKLPKDEYDAMIAACDVGLIFLDHRFTIPNCPSRLLAYMQAGLPVLSCTDPNTDIGQIITEGGFGWSCESNDVNAFREAVLAAIKALESGVNYAAVEKKLLTGEYSVEAVCQKILSAVAEHES